MKDRGKGLHIQNLLKELIVANKLYIDEIEVLISTMTLLLLQKTNETIDSTAR